MLGGGGAAADLVGALGDAAQVVGVRVVRRRLPVVQRGLEVLREAQAQPHEPALADQRARAARADAGVVQRHHHGAAALALPARAGPAPTPAAPTTTPTTSAPARLNRQQRTALSRPAVTFLC